MSHFIPAEIIRKKRNGLTLSNDEIRFFVDGYTRGILPDYQMSALLMAIYMKGMRGEETTCLTEAMLNSGRSLDFSHLKVKAVDKHSTGGIGDKATMILAPIAAAAGVSVPMIAGRGLGHTGGTLDKLESIPGFRIGLSLEEFQAQVERIGIAMIGQTSEICPADKKIYALRDVTATIESLPLICASIMSKKLAEGISALVLDVKFGSGAFMKTFADAENLAKNLIEIGVAHGCQVSAFLTDMSQPLGRYIGNSVEIGECVAVLKNEPYRGRPTSDFSDTRELSVILAGEMIWLSGIAKSREFALERAEDALTSGRAWRKFEELCQAQGGDLSRRPEPNVKFEVRAKTTGFVYSYNTEKIGIAALSLGAGRESTTDQIDMTAGIEVHRKLGDHVSAGDILFTLLATESEKSNSEHPDNSLSSRFEFASSLLLEATTVELEKPPVPVLIAKRL